MTDLSEILAGSPSSAGEIAPDSSLVSGADAESGGGGSTSLSSGAGAEGQNLGSPVTTSVVPSGYTISYCPDPREYRIDDVVVPSVTTVLDVLRKDALVAWGQKVGIAGALTLIREGMVVPPGEWSLEEADAIAKGPLKERKLTTYYVRGKAASRGTSVHRGLEIWAATGELPNEDDFPEDERPYIRGLRSFLTDCNGNLEPVDSELMVASKDHGFAGRFDLTGHVAANLELKTGPRTTRTLPAGTGILDMKTVATIRPAYETHPLQLSAYRLAREESGYGRSDWEAILQVSAEGRYDIKINTRRPDHFLAVLNTWRALR